MPSTSVHLREISPDGTVRIVLAGELDLLTAPALRRALLDAVTTPGVRLVEVDLAAVRFLDCVTVGVLVAGRNAARAHAAMLRVVRAAGVPLRVLRLAGVWHLLHDLVPAETVRIPVPR
ncbi:STAS domain-containing protein [Micromonospora sp. CPCC 205371]|nr:STAS domain-containing protein [Micromonospora sp. CPCC 205371]